MECVCFEVFDVVFVFVEKILFVQCFEQFFFVFGGQVGVEVVLVGGFVQQFGYVFLYVGVCFGLLYLCGLLIIFFFVVDVGVLVFYDEWFEFDFEFVGVVEVSVMVVGNVLGVGVDVQVLVEFVGLFEVVEFGVFVVVVNGLVVVFGVFVEFENLYVVVGFLYFVGVCYVG